MSVYSKLFFTAFLLLFLPIIPPVLAQDLASPMPEPPKPTTSTPCEKKPVIIPALKISGYAQAYYSWLEKLSPYSNFEIKRARMSLDATIEEAVKGKLQVDLGSTSNILLDAYINYKPFSFLSLKMGQFKIPFSPEQLGSSSKLDVYHRSDVTGKLSYNYDIGVMAEGNLMNKMVYYGAGIVNGTGRNTSDNNEKKDIVGRIELSPLLSGNTLFKKLSIGAAIQVGRQPNAGLDDELRSRYDAFLKYDYAGFKLQAEYIYQEKALSDISKNFASGWYALLTYKIMPDLQTAVKFEMYDPDRATELDANQIAAIGLNYFFNKIKIQATYRLKKLETDINPAKEFYLLTQVKY